MAICFLPEARHTLASKDAEGFEMADQNVTAPVAAEPGGFKEVLKRALRDAPIEYLNRSDFHLSPERNARPTANPSYSDAAIGKLAASIKATGGLIDPLILTGVKPREETGYASKIVVSGNRRTMAIDKLASETGEAAWTEGIPCRVAKSANQVAVIRAIQIAENAARADLDVSSVAKSLVDMHEACGGDVSMDEVAAIAGATGSEVEIYKRIVELPQAVRDAIAIGEIGDKKAFLLADPKYEIGETDWAAAVRLTKQLSLTALRAAFDKMFTESDETTTTTTTSDKPKGIKMGDLKKYFLPATIERLTGFVTTKKEFDSACEATKKGEDNPPLPECLERKFTQLDIAARIVDAMKVMSGEGGEKSPLLVVVNPFMEQIRATEENTKAKGKAATARDKWIKKQVTQINKCLAMPMDLVAGRMPFATLSDALAAVVKSWGGVSAADANAAGFDLASELGDTAADGKKAKLAAEVHTAWVVAEKAKRDRREKVMLKKKAEAAAAAAAK